MHALFSVLVFTSSFPSGHGPFDVPAPDGAAVPSLAATLDTTPASQDPAQQPQVAKDPAKDGLDMRVYWKEGFRLETSDKSFSMRISGRLQQDWAWFSADEDKFEPVTGELNDGAEVRRAYLGVDGKIFSEWEYKIEFDFAKSVNEFADAYLGRPTGIGNLRAGNFKPPQGLEELTSDLNTTFMERTLSGAFKTGRRLGVMMFDSIAEESGTWAAGVFRDSDANAKSSSKTSDDEYIFAARGTWAPVYSDGGSTLVHVGGSASWRNPMTNTVSFTSKPEANLAPSFLDTGTSIVDADAYAQYGLEAAAVFGSLSLQSEYMLANLHADTGGDDDPTLNGWYVYASYFLTGEHRPYKRSTGVFDRVKPLTNHDSKGGSGAWEVGLRYTDIDFGEAVAGPQEMQDITAGLNWYPNPFVKVMLNLIQSNLERGALDDDALITELRLQFDI